MSSEGVGKKPEQNGNLATPGTNSAAAPKKIDVKLLDQQNAELDDDLDYDSDLDEHNHGSCGCCSGREVGTIQ